MAVLMTHFILDAPPPGVPASEVGRIGSEKLSIEPVKLNYEQILQQLERIGDDWHERSEHKNGRRAKTKRKLESSKTHTWFFMRGNEAIGFCVAIKQGFDDALADRFNIAAKGTEIYKIGLFPEFQHQGYGHCFIPMMQAALLNGQEAVEELGVTKVIPSDRVYLNTRDSNSTDSRHFYQTHGWKMVGEETFIDYSKEGSTLTHTLVPLGEADPVPPEQEKPRKVRPLKPISGGGSGGLPMLSVGKPALG